MHTDIPSTTTSLKLLTSWYSQRKLTRLPEQSPAGPIVIIISISTSLTGLLYASACQQLHMLSRYPLRLLACIWRNPTVRIDAPIRTTGNGRKRFRVSLGSMPTSFLTPGSIKKTSNLSNIARQHHASILPQPTKINQRLTKAQ